MLNGGLELGADSLVALTCLLSGENALFLRLNVSHVWFLSNVQCEASTLRHDEDSCKSIARCTRYELLFSL